MEQQMKQAQEEIETEKHMEMVKLEAIQAKQEILTPGSTPTPRRTPARIGL